MVDTAKAPTPEQTEVSLWFFGQGSVSSPTEIVGALRPGLQMTVPLSNFGDQNQIKLRFGGRADYYEALEEAKHVLLQAVVEGRYSFKESYLAGIVSGGLDTSNDENKKTWGAKAGYGIQGDHFSLGVFLGFQRVNLGTPVPYYYHLQFPEVSLSYLF